MYYEGFFSLTIETLEMFGIILLTQLRMFLHFHQIWLLIKIKWSAGEIDCIRFFMLSRALAKWLGMWHLKQFGFNARWCLAVGLFIIKDCFSKI